MGTTLTTRTISSTQSTAKKRTTIASASIVKSTNINRKYQSTTTIQTRTTTATASTVKTTYINSTYLQKASRTLQTD